MLWLALCSLKLFNSIRVPHDKLKFSQISCSIWFSILPFTCLHSPRWVLVQLPRTKHEPKTGFCSLSRLAVVQIYLQGARLHRVEAPAFPCYRGSTLAAEQGERKEARKKRFKEKNTKKTLNTERCYKSHSPTPFGQTNLKTNSLTRLSLRTSLRP